MAKTIRPLFSWRAAICKSELDSSTKLTLFALSFYMNEMGASCFPTQIQLAADSSLSESSIRRSIKRACKIGWLKRQLHGFKGQKWKNYEYYASIPIGMSQFKGAVIVTGAIKKDRSYSSEAPVNDVEKDRSQRPTNTPYNSSLTLQEFEEEKERRLQINLGNLRAARKPYG